MVFLTDSSVERWSERLQPLRSAARAAIDLGQRARHPIRRRRARSHVRRVIAGGVEEILFVCHGNICRSPFAERLFTRLVGEDDHFGVASSGFYPETGRRSPPEAIAAARRRGVDLEGHRSRHLDGPSLRALREKRPLIAVMDAGQRDRLRDEMELSAPEVVVLGDLDPESVPHRRIEDPWGGDREKFDRVFARIDRCVRELADLTGSQHGAR